MLQLPERVRERQRGHRRASAVPDLGTGEDPSLMAFGLCACRLRLADLAGWIVQSWDIDYSGYVVELDGFVAGAANTVQFGNPSAWAPDFVRIGIAA